MEVHIYLSILLTPPPSLPSSSSSSSSFATLTVSLLTSGTGQGGKKATTQRHRGKGSPTARDKPLTMGSSRDGMSRNSDPRAAQGDSLQQTGCRRTRKSEAGCKERGRRQLSGLGRQVGCGPVPCEGGGVYNRTVVCQSSSRDVAIGDEDGRAAATERNRRSGRPSRSQT
ncbi:unnamed protein product [Pleuronectes platessa]|uniref:Uncharacterized protein n=1 Tax=Pleuronectes platessa TaxID=8262 RepID=A0A9N7YWZ4_PLEPL|nr:unnamed protein product [Pleuronectes platessa]